MSADVTARRPAQGRKMPVRGASRPILTRLREEPRHPAACWAAQRSGLWKRSPLERSLAADASRVPAWVRALTTV